MRGFRRLLALACTLCTLLSGPSIAIEAAQAPETGAVVDGVYRNAYFGFAYRLPDGWIEGAAGPLPSARGYYVLESASPEEAPTGMVLIAAQDEFFAARKFADAATMARDFERSTAAVDGMSIDRSATDVVISGHHFSRVDFSGVGLYRAMLVTELRCHLVSFNLTSRDPALLQNLVASLDGLVFAAGDEQSEMPACVENYASGGNLQYRVEPVAAGPKFMAVPVRIVIARDGRVKHLHVIHGTEEQRQAIAEALANWRFKPYRGARETEEVETGLLFRFAAVSNSTGD